MLRRTCHLNVVTILYAQTLVKVACGTVSVCIVAIEAKALECGRNETEVTLICYLYAKHTCLVGVDVLFYLELLLSVFACESEVAAEILVRRPLYIYILYVLVEETEADESYTLEVVVDREINVDSLGWLGVRITDCCFLVRDVEGLVSNECRVLRT